MRGTGSPTPDGKHDAGNVGGISAATKAMALASAHGLEPELESYGHLLSRAANLHVMLGVAGCSYFEHPVPVGHYEYVCANPIRIEADAASVLPTVRPRLDLDWNRIECDASPVIDSETM